MPPETPTTTTRPRSGAFRGAACIELPLLDCGLVVLVRHVAADRAPERLGGHLAVDRLAGAARPVVEPARLARGHDRDLVLVGSGSRDQGCQFRHGTAPFDFFTPRAGG